MMVFLGILLGFWFMIAGVSWLCIVNSVKNINWWKMIPYTIICGPLAWAFLGIGVVIGVSLYIAEWLEYKVDSKPKA